MTMERGIFLIGVAVLIHVLYQIGLDVVIGVEYYGDITGY
jgi:hypothetical protein